jgi:hypothetical protein
MFRFLPIYEIIGHILSRYQEYLRSPVRSRVLPSLATLLGNVAPRYQEGTDTDTDVPTHRERACERTRSTRVRIRIRIRDRVGARRPERCTYSTPYSGAKIL